ncbi:MAG TPA: glycosyltransferase N-terminal domain-containing protein [Bacteroidota bacterium]|jgi:3-deoxy-D-manno-octulosonic-acid transferase|nr:glycosyltransferase N-terminal domain-containing protein [Bacteroidota bacterium]
MFWRFFYNSLIVPLGWIGFHVVSLFSPKVRRGIAGRKTLFQNLGEQLRRLPGGAKRVWFHSSSMGEFEQAKPIIAELRRRHPEIQVVVSFFSPSGYEHSRNYKLADVITYIPFDSYLNAEKFLDLVRPSAMIMMRYDVWPNHLWAAQRRQVPTFIASATLRSTTARRVPVLRQFFKSLYNSIDYILTVSDEDRRIFESLNVRHPLLEVIGDTRYDQVLARSIESKARQLLSAAVVRNKRIFVVGSSWSEDEDHIVPACTELMSKLGNLLVLLVPHEPTVEHLERVEERLNGNVSKIRFSEINGYRGENFIIVDSVGVLMPLYQYATVAYVGGSFGGGVHNVLEPAVYGVPILFGPNHKNSQEALQLLREEAAFVAEGTQPLAGLLQKLFDDEALRSRAGERARTLVTTNAGATARFLSYLQKLL